METHTRIKDLIDKIQKEGLDQVNQKADHIIAEARAEAVNIISNAKEEAQKILEKAKTDAEAFAERVKADVRISQQQALAKLKKDITELVLLNVIKEPLDSSLKDEKFMNTLLENMIKNWKNCSETKDLHILVPQDQLESSENHFRRKVKDLIDIGLVIKEFPGITRGFELQPVNGNYKISMTDEAFEMFIREHFEPKTVELLFGGKKE
jgi:V/A-type H+-transporting ATPase subunit E